MSKKSWHFWESDIWHKSSNICTATLRTVTSWSSGMWIRYGNTACSNNSSYEDWLGQRSYVWHTRGVFLYVKLPPGYTVLAIWEVESRKHFHDILKCRPFLYPTRNSLATKTSLRSWKHKRTNGNHTQNSWTEKIWNLLKVRNGKSWYNPLVQFCVVSKEILWKEPPEGSINNSRRFMRQTTR